ncbi:hypothetical protein GOBAR_AA06161 [Gossypium barbadense]|uniref:Transposase MuDR plant domain-containing protein n=1 Tax=Gossypium barbadense TaxID=3634 RepID=A0A2P5YFR5_GOSBA|nr:hypothetical protein GOBAR_AA06161 [Gossypium barbadense]
MELLDDDDVETMVLLHCPLGRVNTKLVQLFTELAYAEPVENATQLSQEYGVEDPCIEVPRVFVDRRLHIHPVVIETDALGEDRSDNDDCFDYECEDFSDPNLDDALDDINDGGPNDGNDHAPSIENSSCGIVIRNDPRAYMSIVDPDAAYASEFPEYPNIIHVHLMLANPKLGELLVGQIFASKDDAIKRYSMKVADSKLTVYVGECWRLTEGYKWWVRAIFIQRSQSRRYENMLDLIHALLHV